MNVLLGRNGAGKSTLCRVLTSVESPTSGAVTASGSDVDGAERELHRGRTGWLPQTAPVAEYMKVEEYLRYAAWVKGVPASARTTAVDDALARTGLTSRRRDRIRGLSGGMVRRLGIAQATINGPSLLVLDEPTAGLDPEQRSNFYSMLRQCINEDTVVLVSTHILEDVVELGGKATVLDEGRILFDGPLADLLSRADVAESATQQLRAAFLDLLPSAKDV